MIRVFTSVVGNGKEKDTWFWYTRQVNRQAEPDLQAAGLEWIVVRNRLFLEKDLAHIVKANRTGAYRNIVGPGRCGYITVDELVFATEKLACDDRYNGHVFNLVGEILTQSKLVELVNQVVDLKV
jgi:NAD(P)H dehydrogenase (quinone)